MPHAHNTLRDRLTRSALVPALAVIAISSGFDYLSALKISQKAQDGMLYKTAAALATRMGPDEYGESNIEIRQHLSAQDEAMLRADDGDEIHFIVTDERGELMIGDSFLLPLLAERTPPTTESPEFSDAVILGKPVRLVDLRHPSKGYANRVLVTETNHKRGVDAQKLLLNTLWPNLLLLLMMLLLMRRGIAHALLPLRSLGAAIDQRAQGDLAPVPQHNVPGEIRPFVSAINRMLERFERSSSEQQMFLSGAAHQLRTPLAGIKTQLELAALDATPAMRERLDRIHNAVEGLTHCTQQMLALARSSEQAGSTQAYEKLDLSELLEDAASTWLDVALKRGIDLDFEPAFAPCVGVRWMLHEMLGNLIDNAIKYSPPAGRITIRCGTSQSGGTFLEVEDEGPGIPKEDRHRVCEPYYRSAKVNVSGSGLGLAIVQEVSSRHQATLAFLDAPSGKGIRIRVEMEKFVPG